MFLYHLTFIVENNLLHKVGVTKNLISIVEEYQTIPVVFYIVKCRKVRSSIATIIKDKINLTYYTSFKPNYLTVDNLEEFNNLFWEDSDYRLDDYRPSNISLATRDSYIQKYLDRIIELYKIDVSKNKNDVNKNDVIDNNNSLLDIVMNTFDYNKIYTNRELLDTIHSLYNEIEPMLYASLPGSE